MTAAALRGRSTVLSIEPVDWAKVAATHRGSRRCSKPYCGNEATKLVVTLSFPGRRRRTWVACDVHSTDEQVHRLTFGERA